MSSRLFQQVREKRGLCYTIYAQTTAHDDTGMMTIYAGTSGAQIGELAEITVDELKNAHDEMSENEVARARAQIRAGLVMGSESPASRVERLARMIAIWGRVPPIEETVAKISAVSLGDVREFAKEMSQASLAMAVYGPVSGAPTIGDLQRRLAG